MAWYFVKYSNIIIIIIIIIICHHVSNFLDQTIVRTRIDHTSPASYLLPLRLRILCLRPLQSLSLHPEGGGTAVFRNVDIIAHQYTVPQPRNFKLV
jgi:hypothetical protein